MRLGDLLVLDLDRRDRVRRPDLVALYLGAVVGGLVSILLGAVL